MAVNSIMCPFCGSTSMTVEVEISDDTTQEEIAYVECGKCRAKGPVVYIKVNDTDVAKQIARFKAMELWEKRK